MERLGHTIYMTRLPLVCKIGKLHISKVQKKILKDWKKVLYEEN